MDTSTTTNVLSYLSFKIGEEEYAVDVGKVLHILEMTELTKVPKAPDYMAGVVNLRGQVLPVVDAGVLFGTPPIEVTISTCIIVMEFPMAGEQILVGMLVDQVMAVHEISDEEIKQPPSIGDAYQADFITGVTSKDNQFIMVLDVSKLISKEQIQEINNH